MFVFTGLFVAYVGLVVADLFLYWRLEKRMSRLEEMFLIEDEEEYGEWTDTLNSHSQSL